MERKRLENYKFMNIKIKDMIEELKERKELESGLVDVYGTEKVRSSRKVNDKMAQEIARILDDTKKDEDLILLLKKQQKEVIDAINKIDNLNYQSILFKRYILSKGLKIVAEEIGYDYKYTCTLLGYALKEFEKK